MSYATKSNLTRHVGARLDEWTLDKQTVRQALHTAINYEERAVADIRRLLAEVEALENEHQALQEKWHGVQALQSKWREAARATPSTGYDGVKKGTLLQCADELLELTR